MQNTGVEQYVPIEALAKNFSVSVSTIRTWMRAGYIPSSTYIKIGATYRFQPKRVEAALAAVSNEQDPETAIKQVEPEQEEQSQEQLVFKFSITADDDI